MKISSIQKKSIIIIAVVIGVGILALSSYAIYKSNASGNVEVSTAKFQIKLNNSESLTQNIILKDTITTNNYSDDLVVPGTKGMFDLELDFTNVDVSVNYTINFTTSNLPNNLKLYSDSNYTNQILSLNDSYTIGSSLIKTNTIYWKWDYLTDSASNENDNSFMNREISLPVTITLTQIVGGN